MILPFCIGSVGEDDYHLDLGVLQRDVARIQLAHRDAGYYGTRVLPVVDEAEDGVAVRFRIEPGDLTTLTALEVAGAERCWTTAALSRACRWRWASPFAASTSWPPSTRCATGCWSGGTRTRRCCATTRSTPSPTWRGCGWRRRRGPLVTVDSIRFLGNYRLDARDAAPADGRAGGRPPARHGPGPQPAQPLRAGAGGVRVRGGGPGAAAAHAGQRCSCWRTASAARCWCASIEAPRYAAELALAYGSRDCLRAEATHTDRNFLGGARRLEVTGLVAKVGVGDPVGGLDRSLCPAFNPDDRLTPEDSLIADQLNWRLAANFVQPRLFGTQTSVVLGAFTERISELDLYVRDATGARGRRRAPDPAADAGVAHVRRAAGAHAGQRLLLLHRLRGVRGRGHRPAGALALEQRPHAGAHAEPRAAGPVSHAAATSSARGSTTRRRCWARRTSTCACLRTASSTASCGRTWCSPCAWRAAPSSRAS